MLFKKNDNNDYFEEFEKLQLDEGTVDNEFIENLDGDLDMNVDSEEIIESNITPMQKYSTILRVFLDDYTELSSSRDRLSAMLEIGIFDDESIEIIEDVIWHVGNTLKTYLFFAEKYAEQFKLLNARGKNIDYRIRKSLEIEQNALYNLGEGIKTNNQDLAQNGIDENEKALNLISPILPDIEEIIMNAFYE